MTTLPCNCSTTSFNPCSCSNFPIIPSGGGGGGSAAQSVFVGNGSPQGVVFPVPSVTAAIYIQQDSAPPGLLWSYYQGVWH